MNIWFSLVLLIAGLLSTACVTPVSSIQTTTYAVPTRDADGHVRKMINGKEWVVPTLLDIDRWIPMGRVLTQREADIMHLRKEKLPYGGFYHNELRERRTFEVTWLETGTEVWMTSDGIPRYLVSCGNLITPTAKLVSVPTDVRFPGGIFHYRNGDEEVGEVIGSYVTTTPTTTTPGGEVGTGTPTPGSTSTKFQAEDSEILDRLVDFLRWTLSTGVAIATILLMIWLIWRLAQLLDWSWVPRTTRGLQPIPQPAPVVIPPAAPAVVPPPTPRPAPTRMTRMGPFKEATFSDRQTDGFHVTADGREIGVYRNPVRIEDAGNEGYFVVSEENIT